MGLPAPRDDATAGQVHRHPLIVVYGHLTRLQAAHPVAAVIDVDNNRVVGVPAHGQGHAFGASVRGTEVTLYC